MDIDLELYRREVHVSCNPLIRLSAIDVFPDFPRRTMVFIHGFGGQATQWSYQLTRFAMANRVIALDLRGHGQSDKPAGLYSMEEIQADLHTTLSVLEVDPPCVLVGHSFGGAVVAEYAATHPKLVERLVLVATAGEFKLSPLFRFALGLPVHLLRAVQPFTRQWLHAPFHVLKSWYQNNLSSWIGWSIFRSLPMPTLVIRGHWDLLFEKPLFQEVARAIPHAEDVDVGTSGHMVMLERRDAVNRALERFVAGEARRSWRQDDPDSQSSTRAQLRQERSWLSHYDTGVPYTIPVPQIPVQGLLRSVVRRYPHRIALLYEGGKLSYRQLNREVNRFANALGSLGVTPGDRVMLLMPNVPAAVIGFYGVLKAGGVVVFSWPETPPAELLEQIRSTEIKVILTTQDSVELAQHMQQDSQVAHVIVARQGSDERPLLAGARSGGRELLDFQEFVAHRGIRSPQVTMLPHDLAVIQYTGGTTGTAKGVMLSHANLVANALQTRHWMPEAREGHEVFLSVLSFSHIYGLTTALNLPVSLGATIVLSAHFDLVEILHAIKRHHPTVFPGVPSMYMAMNSSPNVRKFGIDSIKACISGSAPLPMEVQEAFEKLTRGRLVEGYGLTEASPVTHANPLNGLRKVGSIGIPVPSTEARIVELATGRPLFQPGQIGELEVRGPQVMLGYWREPAETTQVLAADGWLRTGDVAEMDEDGYFRIIARKADMWYPDRQESPAFPRDVEEVLFEIPQIKEGAVVAVANQPVAFVVARNEEIDGETIMAYCRRRLPPELVPRVVIFVDEFPRTFIGKILRRELARRYGQRPAAA